MLTSDVRVMALRPPHLSPFVDVCPPRFRRAWKLWPTATSERCSSSDPEDVIPESSIGSARTKRKVMCHGSARFWIDLLPRTVALIATYCSDVCS